MASPALSVQINGGSPVSGDNLNTYAQTCDTAAQLRAFIGVSGVQVYMRGQAAINDGYQGFFYWNASGNAADDNGVTTIVPYGSGTGVWSRIVSSAYTYLVPVTGFSVSIGNGISSLLLTPAGTLATGTVTMPATPLDGQIVRIASTQAIAALTVSANTGQTLYNAPSSLSAGGCVAFQYSIAQLSWFRIQ